jgi:D-glycero-alpha-D-manno-heptose-7-phosphate kinase
MIITRTPLRISFAGGGSDLPEYYLEHGGAVLSVSIDKYVYLAMHPFFHEKKILLKYSKNELVDNVAHIEHRIIRTVFEEYGITGVDFNSSADVPSGTGLGSSSAFTVGLLNLCNAYAGRYMSREQMAAAACDVEIKRLGEPIGKQDQYASALGGMNYITFNQDDTVSYEKIILNAADRKKLEESFMLFFLGVTRDAGTILGEQKKNTTSDSAVRNNLLRMTQLASELKEELCRGNISAMGDILHRGWCYKRELATAISNERIDHYYGLALKNGASGGKLLGAGGSGFLLFSVAHDNQDRLAAALSDLDRVRFSFESSGTSIIYYDDNR